MEELIKKQDAIDALDKRFDSIPMEQTTEILLLRKDLRELPSAEPQRIRGRWIRNGSWSEGAGMGESYGHYWKCDQCGYIERGDWEECGCNYCSNCGSYNREVTE